jgi:hypothetical protein
MKKLIMLLPAITLSSICFFAFDNSAFAADGFISEGGKRPSVLPIMGWWGIPENEVSRERYREAREAGFTHLMQYAGTVERMRKFLDMAHAEGIRLEAKMTQLRTDPEATARALMDHPALSMYHVKDEPPAQDFAKWAAVIKRISSVDKKHPCYMNLLADASDPQRWLGTPDYPTYLRRAFDEIPLAFLSVDYYPCILKDVTLQRPYRDTDGDVKIKERWYNQLEIVSAAARERGLALTLFACDVAHFNVHFVYPVPTMAMLRLQQYVNLAYGAVALQYFTYWNPGDQGLHKFHESVIRIDGKRGEVYDIVSALNRELHARSGEFVGGKVLDISHTGYEIPMGTRPLKKLPGWVKKLQTPGGGAVVTHMVRDGEEILMVVNRDPCKEMKLDIAFADAAKVKRVLVDGKLASAASYAERYFVAPGYAEIFKIKAN